MNAGAIIVIAILALLLFQSVLMWALIAITKPWRKNRLRGFIAWIIAGVTTATLLHPVVHNAIKQSEKELAGEGLTQSAPGVVLPPSWIEIFALMLCVSLPVLIIFLKKRIPQK